MKRVLQQASSSEQHSTLNMPAGEAPAYNQAKCGRDHEKYPELKNAITDLLLKGDGKSCTPKTLRTLHKDLCDIFDPTSLNNQVGRTKKAIKRIEAT